MRKLAIAIALCLSLCGCWYADYQKAMARTLSPEYRAHEARQEKHGCTQLGC